MTPAELDAIASRYEREWGINRLPLLISEATAARWQATIDKLEAYPTPEARAGMARAWAAVAAEATARDHAPLPAPVAEAEWEPGKVFAVALDAAHAQALNLRNKADKRAVSAWTVAELATLIRSIPIVTDIKDMFPGAEILPPRLPPVGRVPKDEIPFGDAWDAARDGPWRCA